jgi:hypothetical protein
MGLKENGIIGKLIPAGTGMEQFIQADYEFTDEYITKHVLQGAK